MKKNILPYLCGCLLWAHSIGVQAANETYSAWDGSTQTSITPSSKVYTVQSAAELAWIAAQDNTFAGDTIVLDAHIDLQGKKWTPIGSSAKPFEGVFKGEGHLVKGLRSFAGSDGIGLFGHVGTAGKISSVGISGGNLVAKTKRRIGALAGVCAGEISQCWSMAQIAAAGDVVGGLVGELTATGAITDAYHTGLIYIAGDTIGGIVGKNAGRLTRVYNAGYAKNGKAITGYDIDGSFTDSCYYDRKLYYQESGVVNTVVTPIDETTMMFTLYANNTTWTTTTNAYPALTLFAATDASALSVAPVYVNTSSVTPVNHANDLTENFTVSTAGGITWVCQEKRSEEWIQISGSNVTVKRPCSETDVLVDATLGTEKRVVYLRPRRVEDLHPGSFKGNGSYCLNAEASFADDASMTPASEGWGSYFYQVVRFEITPTDTVVLDTLLYETSQGGYQSWFATSKVPTNKSGNFIVRSYVHDDGCITDWQENKPGFHYTVAEEFVPGTIQSGTDTLFLTTKPIYVDVQSKTLSTGGKGSIEYWWNVSVDDQDSTVIAGATAPDLSNYAITKKGKYRFTRGTRDGECYNKTDSLEKLGSYTFYVFDAFDPGEIQCEANKVFCSVEDAQAYSVSTTAASGGIEGAGYHYQWFMVSGIDTTVISGAVSQNLDLSQIALKEDSTYTFVRKAKDNQPQAKWLVSRDSLSFFIAPAFVPGTIQSGVDTLFLTSTPIYVNVKSKSLSSGGVGTIRYWWNVSINNYDSTVIAGQTAPDLTNYAIVQKGQYRFTRGTRDSLCGNTLSHLEQYGSYTYHVFSAFNPGKIQGADSYLQFCTPDEAHTVTIHATAASGGVESAGYNYQWFTVSGTDTTAINGAVNQNLSLSDVTLQAGKNHVFVRKARFNAPQGTWMLSANSATVYIARELNAGAIPSDSLENYCAAFDANGSENITVTIPSQTPASGEDGVEYHWYRVLGTDTLEIGNDASLNYTFPLNTIVLGTTYTYIRKANNPGCELKQSEGAVLQYYGQNTRAEETVTICASELPYTMEWYDADSVRHTHVFETAEDTWTVSDILSDYCAHDTVFSLDTLHVPSFTMDSVASLCQYTSELKLYVQQIEGISNVFRIEYSPDLAKYMGKTDTIGQIPASGFIEFTNIPAIGIGDCYMLVHAGYSEEDVETICFSRNTQKVDIYSSLGGYVHNKFNRVLFVDNNPDNGALGEGSQKLKFKAYQWYKNRVLQEGKTEQYYHENGQELNGIYYVELTDVSGKKYRSCEVTMPEAVATDSVPPSTSTIYPVPVEAGAPLTVEGSGSIEIRSLSGEYISSVAHFEEKTVIAAPHAAGIYYVRINTPEGGFEMHKLIVK